VKNTGRTLGELEISIKEILRLYQKKTIDAADDGSIKSVFNSKHTEEIDSWLKCEVVEIRSAAISLWQQQPRLSKPPKSEADPIAELQNMHRWIVANKILTTSSGKAGDEVKTTPETDQNASRWQRMWTWFNGVSKTTFQIFTKSFWEAFLGKYGP
jgi:hypothetical protein